MSLIWCDSLRHYGSDLSLKYLERGSGMSLSGFRRTKGGPAIRIPQLSNGDIAELWPLPFLGGTAGQFILAARVRMNQATSFTQLISRLFGIVALKPDGTEFDQLGIGVRPDGHLEFSSLNGLAGSTASDLAVPYNRDVFLSMKFTIVGIECGGFSGDGSFIGLDGSWAGKGPPPGALSIESLSFGSAVGYTGTQKTSAFDFWDVHILGALGDYQATTWTLLPDLTSATFTITYPDASFVGAAVTLHGTLTEGTIVFQKNEGAGWVTVQTFPPADWTGFVGAGSFRICGINLRGTGYITVELSYAPNSLTALGDHAIECLFPNGIGNYSDFSPEGAAENFACVGEPAPDEDATYVGADTVALKDTYFCTSLASTEGTVPGLIVWRRTRKDSADAYTTCSLARSGAVDGESESDAVASGYGYLPGVIEMNPDTDDPFTPAEINTAEFGHELKTKV